MSATPNRPEVADATNVVVKLGTRVLTNPDGQLALGRLFNVVETIANARSARRTVLLVSSGAVGLGRDALGLDRTPKQLAERQACAAVGQSRLMALYSQGFSHYGIVAGQVLLTEGDFADRKRYLNLRNTVSRLLAHGVVPILNENDSVSVDELEWIGEERSRPVFGDNDRLSALLASKLGADLLVLLTDVDGVFDRDPSAEPDARCISRVDDPQELATRVGGPRSEASRGGMRSKVEAAYVAARSGCHAVIASGLRPEGLRSVLNGEDVGTWFPAHDRPSARRRWIAFASRCKGALTLDAGAIRALTEASASLLAAGVTQVDGEFERGDIVELRGANGAAVGRGISQVDVQRARHWVANPRPRDYDANPKAISRRGLLVRREELVMEAGLKTGDEGD